MWCHALPAGDVVHTRRAPMLSAAAAAAAATAATAAADAAAAASTPGAGTKPDNKPAPSRSSGAWE